MSIKCGPHICDIAWIDDLNSNLHILKCKTPYANTVTLGIVMPTPKDVRLNPDDKS
jgi:hypothetical protein